MVEQIDKGIEVKDEIGTVMVEQLLEERENDVKAYTKALENAEKDLANYEEQLNVDREIWEILEKPGAVRMLNPNRAFEKDDRYWELMEKKQAFQLRSDRDRADGQIKYLEQQIKFAKEALAGSKQTLENLKKENIEIIARSKRNKEA